MYRETKDWTLTIREEEISMNRKIVKGGKGARREKRKGRAGEK